MDNKEKLVSLINHLELNQQIHSFFNGGELRGLKIEREKKSWTFNIAVDEVLP